MNKMRLPAQQLEHLATQRGSVQFFRQPVEGQWHSLSYAEVNQQVRKMAAALLQFGIQPDDKIAIFAKNSQEWMMADWAIGLAGAVSVPIFPAADRDTIQYIMQHSEAKAVFVGKLDNHTAYEGVFGDNIITIAFPYPTISCQHHWQALLDDAPEAGNFPVRKLSDLMTIIYTSGSTGTPKGVMHTFETYGNGVRNFLTDFKGALNLSNERVLSYLPLAHITERVLGGGMCLYADDFDASVEVSFTESLEAFPDNLRETAPTLFVSVPRLWQKFQSGVLAKMPQHKLDKLLRIPLLNRYVKHKIKKTLGFHKAKVFASGSAPIAPSLLEWYMTLDINISQGWGMTETNAVGTTQTPFRADKAVSIGKSLPNVDLRIAEEQELQIKSNCVMTGYYKQPELSDEVFTPDGYFKTGDQARIDEDGYAYIIGRIKDIFKTAKGKYVAPAPIEAIMARSTLIEQICVVGTELSQPVAVVTLSDLAQGQSRDDIATQLKSLLESTNSQLEKHEKLAGIKIMPDVWSTDNGLITPTLKIRRHAIEEFYAPQIKQPMSSSVEWH